MVKKIALFSLFCILTLCTTLIAEDIAGFWKSINDKSGKPESIIAIYKYQDKYYGRIIGTFDDAGKMDDSIYNPKGRAPGVKGNPFYCGMDIIWDLHHKGSKYKGKILDPQKGNVYNAQLWVKNGNLIVRGEILFFGRNETWPPAVDSDFPRGFKKPDVAKFDPLIPEVN
ncbi:MAG: DUF2147 domain-containing protein [Anaerolineae bacterium]